ncbi:MAG: hypothetical protein CVU57_00595 [Deltaproteobacteria bacterium HGW-Deltaproteobacteria-15]|nr:MAG: hypothetical protein CVU57_00595 [Deltaproteobacteria bacterium HGW-Deltaproteobacteria-15]
MPPSPEPTLSACMIVKDEEKSLPHCLRSIRDHVDEIIVVDTGSTDMTVSIAESFGARVFHQPWENHFSRHRNQSMSLASGEWLFIVDADEVLLPFDGGPLRAHMDLDDSFDSVMIGVECASPIGVVRSNSVRFIRNHRTIRYQGRVHNYLVGVKKTFFSPIRLYHHGYNLGEETDRKKFERTTSLLKLDLAEEPDNPRPYHFLAASCLSTKRFKEAAEYAEKGLVRFEKNQMVTHNYLWCLYMASASHFHLSNLDKAASYAEKAITLFHDHLDSHHMLAVIAARQKNRTLFERHAEKYNDIKGRIETSPESFGELVHNTLGSGWVLDMTRGFFLLEEGQGEDADEVLRGAFERCPDSSAYHLMLGLFYENRGDHSLAESHYMQALEKRPTNVEALWSLAGLYEQLNRPERIPLLEKILSLNPDLVQAHHQLGLAFMKAGDFQQALSHFNAIEEAEPENARARINEALCLRGMGLYERALERSSAIETKDREEILTLVSNVALSYDGLGQTEKAVAWFQRMAEIEPADPLPAVFLSKLYLDMAQIESCVFQCDRLLSLLGIENNVVLSSLKELGDLFHRVGKRLDSRERPDLGKICFHVAQRLERFPGSQREKRGERVLLD